MPAYNHEQYVEEAVMSVINQTYPNIELIVIDDGSTDNTPKILKKLQNQYHFKLFLQHNQGQIKCQQQFQMIVTGEYISLFSSDDLYEPTKIEKLFNYLHKYSNYSMVYSKIILIDGNGSIMKYIDEAYKGGRIFYDLLSAKFSINGLTTLLKRNVYLTLNFKDGYMDDFPLWLQIAKHHEIGFVDEFLSYYRIHNNHLSSNLLKMQEAERKTIDLYKNEPSYAYALCKWNLRWFNNTSRCYKYVAIKQYLLPSLCIKNIFSSQFLKAIIKLFLPCNKNKKDDNFL